MFVCSSLQNAEVQELHVVGSCKLGFKSGTRENSLSVSYFLSLSKIIKHHLANKNILFHKLLTNCTLCGSPCSVRTNYASYASSPPPPPTTTNLELVLQGSGRKYATPIHIQTETWESKTKQYGTASSGLCTISLGIYMVQCVQPGLSRCLMFSGHKIVA